MKNKFKTIKRVSAILICMITIGILCLTVWNKALSIKENKNLQEIGENVEVNGINMRISKEGDGEKTIVLLSGLGTPDPIIDFKPLAEKLGRNYKVVTLEYPGYGLSDDTDEERSSENIVQDIREALRKSGAEPPYILMPHSISGIYCMQYMNSYPEEVAAMIGIDSSVPEQARYDEMEQVSGSIYNIAKLMDITGLSRLSYISGNDVTQNMKDSGNYSNEDINNILSIMSRKSITKAQFNEMQSFQNNCQSLFDKRYPADIPVLFLLSNESCEEYEKKYTDITWDGVHEQTISNPLIQKIEYLQGKHYLHWTQADKISDMTDEFIRKYVQ